jgi:outer membrane protein OmpA-like peptidoglycan-associated protein
MKLSMVFLTMSFFSSTVSYAQAVQQRRAIASSDVMSQISIFNYREGPESDLLFRGTPIVARGDGKAEIEYQNGNARISAEVDDLPEPSSFGPYTTYLLWALTPDGRAVNQGVVLGPDNTRGKIETMYPAPQFALIVTAEPHFAVSAPSTMIALYNVADNVRGTESRVTTLVERLDYSDLMPIEIDSRTNPAVLVQARYAVAIAESADAGQFAPRAYATATEKLAAAETALAGSSRDRRTVPGLAREAVIAGADAHRAALIAAAASIAEAERAAAAAEARREANEIAARAAAEAATAAEAEREAAARAARERGEAEAAAAARESLVRRLNAALPTRETDRGLVSEIGGVQFATGAATISPAGRESLARFAGVVASFPSLRFKIEGHTDNVGSVANNNDLSLRRAISVRDYLTAQGVIASNITVEGLGSSMPVDTNTTAEGRARNRRVEIVLTGGILGVQ